jgi:hypothetical protein
MRSNRFRLIVAMDNLALPILFDEDSSISRARGGEKESKLYNPWEKNKLRQEYDSAR